MCSLLRIPSLSLPASASSRSTYSAPIAFHEDAGGSCIPLVAHSAFLAQHSFVSASGCKIEAASSSQIGIVRSLQNWPLWRPLHSSNHASYMTAMARDAQLRMIHSCAAASANVAAVVDESAVKHGSLMGVVTDSESEETEEDDHDNERDLSMESEGLTIASLGLPIEIVNALSKKGIKTLFPIQRAVLEPAMEGRDLIARAKTGTGKTLAFGIPIINHITRENLQSKPTRFAVRHPRALVLAPTRELAKQVERQFMESAPSLSTICVYGGVSIIAQQRQLERGVDVAVGTPGRIIDLINRGSLVLKNVKFLVLDEADTMLAVGFEEDVEKILQELPAQRQSMLFSATMPAWVKQLSKKYLKNTLVIDLVGDNNEKLAEGIKLFALSTVNATKKSILSDLIAVYGKGGKIIVFTQTKRDADDVALAMGRRIGCEALHGDISQYQREKTLDAFRDGKISVLVATDVAARGLDVPNVDLVIHFAIPNDPETFVHRSGRTGRAGKEGTVILMYTAQQIRNMQLIEQEVGCRFKFIGPPNSEDVARSLAQYPMIPLKKLPRLEQEAEARGSFGGYGGFSMRSGKGAERFGERAGNSGRSRFVGDDRSPRSSYGDSNSGRSRFVGDARSPRSSYGGSDSGKFVGSNSFGKPSSGNSDNSRGFCSTMFQMWRFWTSFLGVP
ncbi:hypothetical protein O6H91_Y211800 [Diphasiastrum complanatum]|nr:hypothetical protein O6H91_Y211800 [Diphasiastrum complanatum]